MGRPVVLIHGYSSEGTAFDTLKDQLTKRKIQAEDINICTYVSLNNEITIKDIAEGLDRACRTHPVLGNENQAFDAIVHSTGMLVIRSWLTNYGAAVGSNRRLARLKHLIGLAPATWGSPQAHKGRTWLGALVKGNRQLGPDFMNAGDQVLDGLELGSAFTWDLAHADLLGDAPYYDKGAATPFVSVFIGNTPYEGLSSVADDPGTDGTVRWAGCGLNTRKITLDLTRTPTGPDGKPISRATITPWAVNRLDVPIIAVEGRNHASLVGDPEPGMVDLLVDFLKVGDEGGETYDQWLARAQAYGKPAMQKMLVNPGAGAAGIEGAVKERIEQLIGHKDAVMDGWQQFVIHVRDEHGDGISDYLVDVLHQNEKGEWVTFEQMYTDVHAYGADPSYRCFHIRLPAGLASGKVPIKIRIHASTGTDIMVYQGYSSDETRTDLTATSGPVEVDISNLPGDARLFFPFTTTLIEIVLNREPFPLDQISRVLWWLDKTGNG